MPKIGARLEFWQIFVRLKIGRNKNFIMQMAYGDKNLFCNFFLLIIEKFDFLVKIRPEKEVWGIYFFGQE